MIRMRRVLRVITAPILSSTRRIRPGLAERDQEHRFPEELVAEMGSLDLLGAPYSEFGLPGVNAVTYGLINRELERGDSGLRSFVSVQTSLVMFPILQWGSDEQQQRWIPALGRGDAIGCFGLTEPDFGSNPSGMRTRAERRADGTWLINGTKMWITNGSIADVALVWAATEEGVRGFLIEKDTPGFSAPQMKGKWSLRASVTSELILDHVVVDESTSLLPGITGLKGPLSCLTQARYGISWGALGAAEFCFAAAREYGMDRKQFNRPLAANQLYQKKLADMATKIELARLITYKAAWNFDQGRIDPPATRIFPRQS